VGPLRGFLDGQVIVYTVLALIPNLLLILWAMARLSREVHLLKSKAAMVENDINLLDQSISSLSAEFQAIRKLDKQGSATGARLADRPE
jgi:Tfp pilus assembly protein PilN